MKSLIKWMASNHVAANLLMLFFVVGGLIMASSIKQEVFPDIELDLVQISVAYFGAGPEEIEEGIILPIEDRLSSLDSIKEIRSIAKEGIGIVTAELYENIDPDIAVQDIKNEIDQIVTFPKEAEKPIIRKVTRRRQVLYLALYGNVPEMSLHYWAEKIKDDLLALPEISHIDLTGVKPYEISIEVPESNLKKYGLTLSQISRRIAEASIDIPAGDIENPKKQILLRTKEKRYKGREYGNISIISDGYSQIKLKDIGIIKDGFRDIGIIATFDSLPCAMLEIYRVGKEKPKDIANAVQKYIAEHKNSLPPSLHLAIWNNRAEILKSRLDLLIKNGLTGLLLVILILGIFLQIRLAFWVMLGIPISFLGALFFMPFMEVSINMISLFAFIMALGIVVDDAIVVGENIYTHRGKGKSPFKAAVDGTSEVAVPVIFAVLTTITAFSPLLFVSGSMGKFISVIAKVAIIIFLLSLVESLFILPAHLNKSLASTKDEWFLFRWLNHLSSSFGKYLNHLIYGPFNAVLTYMLKFRYVSLALALASIIITIGMIGGNIIKYRFFPKVESDTIKVRLQMIPGTSAEETAKVLKMVEEKGRLAIAHFEKQEGKKLLKHVYSIIGNEAEHKGKLSFYLIPSGMRHTTTRQISNYWRKSLEPTPGVEFIAFQSDLIHMGDNIDIRFYHNDFKVLESVAQKTENILSQYDGVNDIANTLSRGKPEIKIKIKPEAAALGISEKELGSQIRNRFYGATALRMMRGPNEVWVMVRLPKEERKTLWSLKNIWIRKPDNTEIPLEQAAYLIPAKGYNTINHSEGLRIVDVTANVDENKANPEEILSDLKKKLFPQLKRDYPSLRIKLMGEAKRSRESMQSLKQNFFIALIVMYGLLAIPFRSYLLPMLIMAAIPFGMVGAILGHFLLGKNLSMMSMFGMVALAGVVVNDSLLLLDYANKLKKQGLSPWEAIKTASLRRFRPILLTSLTTFFGLIPMLTETSKQAQFLIPMAISLAFGILFATGVTLIIIPALYLVLNDIKRIFSLSS